MIANFKNRFIASLPEAPPDLDLRWDQFVTFDPAVLENIPLASEDSALLTTQGLPCDASPFLSFHAYTKAELTSRKETFGIPDTYFPIGHNGSGDVLAIDLKTRDVVYFNHDNNNERILINSTLPLFAESLCIYQEHLASYRMSSCISAIAMIDSSATFPNTMWHEEISSEIANQA